MARAEPRDSGAWKAWGLILLGGIAWPLWAGLRLLRSARFWRTVRRARSSKCTLADGGIEVSVRGGAAQFVPWPELGRADWRVHVEPAPDFDVERLAVEIPEKGLALSEASGDLAAIVEELARRGEPPRLADGGKGWTSVDGLFALAWWAAVLVAALLLWR